MENLEIHIKVPIHPSVKFGLKALLILILLVASGFATYKFGMDRGHTKGFSEGYEVGWSDSQKLVKRKYDVADLAIEAGSETMINVPGVIKDIQEVVERSSWNVNGGPGEISRNSETSMTLVVRQTNRVHRALEEYLAKRRLELGLESE